MISSGLTKISGMAILEKATFYQKGKGYSSYELVE